MGCNLPPRARPTEFEIRGGREGAQNDNLVCLGAATADQNFAHSLSYRHFSSISFSLVSLVVMPPKGAADF